MERRAMDLRTRFLPVLLFLAGVLSPVIIYGEEKPRIFLFQESSHEVDAVAFSSDGRYALAGSEGNISIWDLSNGSRIGTFGNSVHSTDTMFSPDGRSVLIAPFIGQCQLWDAATGRLIRTFEKIPESRDSMAFSPDGRFVLFGIRVRDEGRCTLVLYDATTGKRIQVFGGEGHSDYINAVAFSPDGRYAVSGSRDFTVKLWDVATGEEIRTFEGHSSYVDLASFSPDGRYILSASGECRRLWDVATGTWKRFDKERGPCGGSIVAFSPDGRYLLSSNRMQQRMITLSEFPSGEEIVRLYYRECRSLAFSPDGRFALCGEKGKQLVLLDIDAARSIHALEKDLRTKRGKAELTWQEQKRLDEMKEAIVIGKMSSFDDGEWVVMTPEGYFNASEKGARHIKIQVGQSTYSINHFFERFYNPGLIARKFTGKQVTLAHDIRKGVARPPRVRILQPKSNQSLDRESIEVVVSAEDVGGGIDEIRLYHNDCALGEGQRGIRIKTEGGRIEKAYTVTLLPGENTFRATAFSRDRTESVPHEISLKHTGSQKGVDLYLVVVGINEYKNPALRLNFAVADAEGIKVFFEKRWKDLFHAFNLRQIYDGKATKENVQKALSSLKAREGDVVLVYFAGHGMDLGEDWYFICHDVVYPERENHLKEKGISSTEMAIMIRDIRALKKALFIDACKSGGLLTALSRGTEDRKAMAQLARSTGTHVIAASTDKQVASEVSQLGHGVFTYALLQGLGGDAGNRDPIVTVRELIAYIEDKLPGIGEKFGQKPQYPVVDSRGQDFPLVVNR